MKKVVKCFVVVFIICFCNFELKATPINRSFEDLNCTENISGISPMAAVKIPGKGIYVFRGNEYYKYKIIDKKRVLLAGYPKKLPDGWQGLPDNFKTGIDAAVYHPPSKTTFFFKGKQYVRISGIKVMEKFPKKLPGGWQNLPATFSKDIDAAMYYEGEDGKEGHIVLVKGDKFVSYKNFKLQVLNGNVKDLWKANLPSPFNSKIDAMLEGTIGTFLISGNSYVMALGNKLKETTDGLSFARRSQIAFGGVNSMTDWQVKQYNLGAPDLTKISADAGVYIPDMGAYIFAGNKYYKYTIDLGSTKKPKLWKDYPNDLPGGWLGLPKSFKKGIDAAFYYAPNKKTYFIKGNQYVRLTGRKVDPKYPRKFLGNWEGLPKSFYSDIDAAFTLGGEGNKTYVILIKNKSFVAFKDWKKVTSGKTKDLWKGLPRGYNKEIQAIISGGLLGKTLFSGDQSILAIGGPAKLTPEFSVTEIPAFGKFKEAESIDIWKLPVRKRPKMSTISGSNNGIDVVVGDKEKSYKKQYKDSDIEESTNYTCTIKHMDEKLVSPDQILLDPTTDVIWPGAIIDGTSIPNGKYKLLSFPRESYTISTSAISATKVKARITKPLEQSYVRQTVNSIINSIKDMPAGKLSFKKEEMYSEKQFRLKFGGSYNTGVVNISAGLDMQSNTKKHRLVVEFAQDCFSIDMDDIGSYKKWIKDASKIDFYNTLPMYVSSIKYGRRAYMSIESNESMSSLETYFSGSYAGAGVKLSTEQKEVLKNSKVKVYIVGGDGKNAAKGVIGDYNAFIKYIQSAPKKGSEVMPIGYKMRFLKDKSVAKVSLSSKYTVRNCTAHQLKWKLTVDDIKVVGKADLYGSIHVYFCNSKKKKVKSSKYIWNLDAGQATTHKTITVNKSLKHNFKDKNQLKGAYVRIEWHYIDNKTLGNEHWNGSKEIYLSDVSDEPISIPTYNKDLQVIGSFTLQPY